MYIRIKAFSTSLLELIDKPLDIDIKQSFRPMYRLLISTLPVLVASLVSVPAASIIGIASVFIIYRYMLPVQDDLAEMTPGEIYFCLAMPLYFYLTLWGGLLLWVGNVQQIFKTIGFEFIVIAPTIAPIYLSEKKRINKDRRLKLQDYYPVFGALAIILHCANIWEYFK